MLSLDSPVWLSLEHAYGNASDTPDLLRQLKSIPHSDGEAEPWFSIWSSLAHQGDVYSASFAAVPHVVACIKSSPEKVGFAYFHFPAWVEICRRKSRMSVPDDLAEPYFDALAKLPQLLASASHRIWDEDFLVCALAAVAASRGYEHIAEAILELSSENAKEFLSWHLDR